MFVQGTVCDDLYHVHTLTSISLLLHVYAHWKVYIELSYCTYMIRTCTHLEYWVVVHEYGHHANQREVTVVTKGQSAYYISHIDCNEPYTPVPPPSPTHPPSCPADDVLSCNPGLVGGIDPALPVIAIVVVSLGQDAQLL